MAKAAVKKAKTVKNPKHNIIVTVNELNQPSDEAVAAFNKIINEIATDIIVERAAEKALLRKVNGIE